MTRASSTVGVSLVLAMLGMSSPATAGPLGSAQFISFLGFNPSFVYGATGSSFSTSTNLYSLNSYTTFNATGPTAAAYLSYGESVTGALASLDPPNSDIYDAGSSVDFSFEVMSSKSSVPVKVTVGSNGNFSASDSGTPYVAEWADFQVFQVNQRFNGASACIGSCSGLGLGDIALPGTSFNMTNTVQLLTNVVYRVAMDVGINVLLDGSSLESGVLTAFVDPTISIAPDPDETLVFSDGISVQGPATVPEPSVVALMFIGLAGLSTSIGRNSRRREPIRDRAI